MRKRAQREMPTLEQLEREKERCRFQTRYRRTLFNTAGVLLVVAAVSVLIVILWLPVYRIYGSSMEPALKNGQIVLAVRSGQYRQGDLVAFYYGNKLLIKRVIAGPENTVDLKENGDVYVNGTLLDEPYVEEKAAGDSGLEFPLRVPEEHWFLLGDNRKESVDSRNEQIGLVAGEQIAGKIILRIWPLDKIQIFDNRMERESQ